MMGKTLITTQQAGLWVGRIKVTEISRQLRGNLWECGVSRYLRINESKSKRHRKKKLSPNCKQRNVIAALLVLE